MYMLKIMLKKELEIINKIVIDYYISKFIILIIELAVYLLEAIP